MARELPYVAAIGEAVHQEMERDENVLHSGESLATHDVGSVPPGFRRETACA